jgi:hypothetical protein
MLRVLGLFGEIGLRVLGYVGKYIVRQLAELETVINPKGNTF